MVIEFGDWQLRPCDGLNWQLWRRVRSPKKGDARSGGWTAQGRYYSYSTIPNAIAYAADCELRAWREDEVWELRDALGEYERILDGFKDALLSQPERLDGEIRP